jgi:hypothetical protein
MRKFCMHDGQDLANISGHQLSNSVRQWVMCTHAGIVSVTADHPQLAETLALLGSNTSSC